MKHYFPLIALPLAISACSMMPSGETPPSETMPGTDTTMTQYQEQGTASWYSQAEHGAQMSSGQIYDVYGMAAAHKSLPFGTQLRVTNPQTGTNVIVDVQDRLLPNDPSVIKLSYTAAEQLQLLTQVNPPSVIVSDLNAPVTAMPPPATTMPPPVATTPVETLPPPVTQPPISQPPVTSTPIGPAPGRYWQAGAFGSFENASRMRNNLIQRGLPAIIHEVGGRGRYKVWVGPYQDQFELSTAQRQLQSAGIARPMAIQY